MTPTASGKSLCYTLPVAASVMNARSTGGAAKALYLFPTKALAQELADRVHALAIVARAPGEG